MLGGLLPEGLRDRLPGEAEAQAARLRAMLDAIVGRGFARVSPPLVEYEEGLAARLQGARTDLARFVDPLTQRTLAVRSDITPQIARIAATSLADAPRPLRLAYAGSVLKLGKGRVDAARESLQVGAELIGSDDVAGAIEIVAAALAALRGAGVDDVTIDLTLPDLVERLVPDFPAERRARLDALLDVKDAGGLRAEGFADYGHLIEAVGPPDRALAILDRHPALAPQVAGIRAVAAALDARVTVDATERHGFEYQSWFGFSLFVAQAGNAVGRGGSYTIARADGTAEPAIGFSLYPDSLEG